MYCIATLVIHFCGVVYFFYIKKNSISGQKIITLFLVFLLISLFGIFTNKFIQNYYLKFIFKYPPQ